MKIALAWIFILLWSNCRAQETPVKHVVKDGENLYRISQDYNTVIDSLMKWNNLPDEKILIGQELKIYIYPSDSVRADTLTGIEEEQEATEIHEDSAALVSPETVATDTFKLEPGSPIIFYDTVPDTHSSDTSNTVVPVDTAQAGLIIPKVYIANRLSSPIKIDGIPNEEEWSTAQVATDFMQLDPAEGTPISQRTSARLLYDHTGIYVMAYMYDTHPDSILLQLGNRDEGGSINSDAFRLGIDPYNLRQNGYVFEVSASGVQTESYDEDLTFDAVWESATQVTDSGWVVEMMIPFSALRFPASAEQVWGIQFARQIRRNREYDQWTLTPKNVQNKMMYWGTMKGMKDVHPPTRLSLTPYLSIYSERAPLFSEGENKGYENSYSYYGGADIKYGLDERFTLDMTLLPDFSQVQSDNKVKNLSAFETIYEERRPFFKEGTALFSKGNLFYSRRIGKTPGLFYSVADSLQAGEVLVDNPDKARLLNATKVSGRTDKGLGIGVLNAVTGNTYAIIRDDMGNQRRILTETATNYNMIVLDQQLPNNCNVYLVNSNVLREGKARDANVTAVQGKFENKKHTFQVSSYYSASRIWEWQDSEISPVKNVKKGEILSIAANKISGKSWYGASYEIGTENYDKNDFSYIFITDYSQFNAYFTHYKFNPFWKYFKYGYITLFTNRSGKLSEDNQLTSFNAGFNVFLLFNNNWSIYTETGFDPLEGHDYYEPRIHGSYYITPRSAWGSVNMTTNYNKRLAFDFGGRYIYSPAIDYLGLGYYITPMIRISDHFNIKFSHYLDNYQNERGFAFLSDNGDSSFFGRRRILSIENSISSRYMFKNDMSLTLTARHYWSRGNYDAYYYLQSNGRLSDFEVINVHDYDFNSSYMTVDLVYNWQFAPGSSFIITYKNLILSETLRSRNDYFFNLSETFSEPQINSVSLKVLYYIDYQQLKGRN